MEIGEKVKELRSAKCLTQAQLAGDFITRNMLSCIENGTAQPSLPTVMYLAKRLNVPVGYLLSSGNEEKLYKKNFNMGNIKRALCDGDYRICRDICRSIGALDDELNMILSRCDSGIAKEEFFFGRLRSAIVFFEEALEYNERTIYGQGVIHAEAQVYLRYMRKISPTLLSDVSDSLFQDELSFNDSFCRYVIALERVEANGGNGAEQVLKEYRMVAASPLSTHIIARAAILHREFGKAQELLKRILNLEERIADPVLYNVFYDLEICSKEIENYREAYEYSAAKVNLFERLLAEAVEA